MTNSVVDNRGLAFCQHLSDVKAKSYKLRLDNDTDIFVEVVFYPLNEELQGVILVYINNSKNEQVINVKDWLKKYNVLPNEKSFKLEGYHGTLNDRLKLFSEFLGDVFSQKNMNLILSGANWEELPFDWSGIR